MKKIGITGASGSIGKELLKQYPNSFPLVGDVTNPHEIEMAVRSEKPDLIVHLAFLSDVDYCEKGENFSHVKQVNVEGTLNVAEIAARHCEGMVFLSSDHVFDGLWGNYKESSRPHPKNMYGMTKMTCEGFSSLYPIMKTVRSSYLLTSSRMLYHYDALWDNDVQEYPTFMYRSFITLQNFVSSFCEYLSRYDDMPNVLHISGSRIVSWYDLMLKLSNEWKVEPHKVQPRTREVKIPGMAPRPYRAGLNVNLSKKLGFPQYDIMA